MKCVVSTEVMRQSDAATVAGGISSRELMRRAGQAIFESYPWRSRVCIVCGSGNNAGDGYVLASLLWEHGISCRLLLLRDFFSQDGAFYAADCRKKGIPIAFCADGVDFSEDAVLVDCIFGTGFCGKAEGMAGELIQAMNACGLPIVSADINSGLNGDSGMGEPCVRSTLTVSIGLYQYGHLLGKAKDVIGALKNADIGIRPISDTKVAYLMEAEDFQNAIPPRKNLSHKGDYGYIGLLGGCTAYAGAVKLANLSAAALRSGCGVATLILPRSLAPAVAPQLLESTLTLLPDHGGFMSYEPSALDAATARLRALAVGMGWGIGKDHAKILSHLLNSYQGSMVIDADGLNTLSGMDPACLRPAVGRVLLTPHLKEFERLSKVPMSELQQAPVKFAQAYAEANGIVLLLKGPTTIVTDGKTTYLVNRGCAGMATAGSGDVLSGILAGLLGYLPMSPFTASLGAYLAGCAGELAAKEMGEISMLAGDTVRCLPQAIQGLSTKR